jgi:hypothetical protein
LKKPDQMLKSARSPAVICYYYFTAFDKYCKQELAQTACTPGDPDPAGAIPTKIFFVRIDAFI